MPWITFKLRLAERAAHIVDDSLVLDSCLGSVAIDSFPANRIFEHDRLLIGPQCLWYPSANLDAIHAVYPALFQSCQIPNTFV